MNVPEVNECEDFKFQPLGDFQPEALQGSDMCVLLFVKKVADVNFDIRVQYNNTFGQ